MAGTLLGLTLQLTQGQYSPFGVMVMGIAMLVGVSGAFLKANLNLKSSCRFLVALLVGQFFVTIFAPADDSVFSRGGTGLIVHCAGLALALIAILPIAFEKRSLAKVGFISALLIFACMGIWKVWSVPKPFIDVHPMHTEASNALLHLENPYAITVADMYGPGVNYYPPSTVINGRIQYGFPYMPLALMYSTPAYVLWGDPRYAYLLAMIAAAGLIAIARPGPIGMLMGLLFLYTPVSLYIVQMCWIEPLCAMLVAATVVCAIRYPRALPIALGLMLASKQYLPAAIGFIPLLNRNDKWAVAGKAMITAALVSLPLALWSPAAFINSTISYQLKAPYRPDSLSFVAWWGYGKPGWAVPFWLSFVALGGTLGWCLARMERGVQSFVSAFAFCFFVFITLSKQTFINYHYLILVAGFLAAAVENLNPRGNVADNTLSDHATPDLAHPHCDGESCVCPARAA